ncbi:MAG: DUF4164 family protein [Pseudomonadota bacterium]
MVSAPESPSADDPLDAAAERLDLALGAVEARMRMLSNRLNEARSGVVDAAGHDEDRARLAEALDASRARETELREAAAEASQALGEAIRALRLQSAVDAGSQPAARDASTEVEAGSSDGQGRYSLFDWEDGDEVEGEPADEPDGTR